MKKLLLFLFLISVSVSQAVTTFTWTGSAGATGYNLYIGTASGSETLVGVTIAPATTLVLAAGQFTNPATYFAYVKAYDAFGALSAPSNEVSWTVVAATPTPTPTPTPVPTPTPLPPPTGLKINITVSVPSSGAPSVVVSGTP